MLVGGDGQGGRVAGAGVYLLTVSSRFSSGFPFNNILLFCLPPSTALIMILVLITCLPSGLDGSVSSSNQLPSNARALTLSQS